MHTLAASIGHPSAYSTIDGETDAERIERLRRLHYELGEEFNEQAVRACYSKREQSTSRQASQHNTWRWWHRGHSGRGMVTAMNK